jgi:Family of unknown function (DUF6880)
MVRQRDAVEKAMESALQPGRFIAWNQEGAFVSGLEEVERGVAVLTDSDPVRAAYLYEAFIAACYLKADEIHSEWEFGNFVGELANGWIRARQAGGDDRLETAKALLSWIDRDDYGFFNDLGSEAAKVLDPDGLAAFETEVRDRFEKASDNRSDPSDHRSGERWARILRSIYAQQGSVGRYVAVAERTGLTPGDCAAVARILESRRKYGDALLWTERGIAMRDAQTSYSAEEHDLAGMHRALLRKLGRVQEALESAWAEFVNRPSLFGYEELMRNVPAAGRVARQERAMAAAEQRKLEPFIELCVKAKEIDRLAKRLECTGDRELEDLSHYVTEPAAAVLRRPYPAVSAKLFRALSIRILRAAKSKYYDAALAHLEDARRCYLAAGLEQQWEALALEIRRDHFRKSSFIPGFNAIIAGKKMRAEPSFLDRARQRWADKAKS